MEFRPRTTTQNPYIYLGCRDPLLSCRTVFELERPVLRCIGPLLSSRCRSLGDGLQIHGEKKDERRETGEPEEREEKERIDRRVKREMREEGRRQRRERERE